jgi:hypothetical protein
MKKMFSKIGILFYNNIVFKYENSMCDHCLCKGICELGKENERNPFFFFKVYFSQKNSFILLQK